MLLGVMLYAYCTGIRSSRQIERRCHEDIAFRVLAANTTPDHVTIARFRTRHEQALAGLLVQSLRLCAAAGLLRLGTVALDGTKLAANAAAKRNRTNEQLQTRIQAEVQHMLAQAAQTDQREDQEDQEHAATGAAALPAELATRGGRLARLRQAKARLDAEAAHREQTYQQRVAARSPPLRPPADRPRLATGIGRGMRRLARTPPPTPPILTVGASMAATAASRATTPRPSPPSTR